MTGTLMQPVSYSLYSLAVTFSLYHSSSARRGYCCSTRIASSFAYFFIPSDPLSVPPSSPPSIVDIAMLCLIRPRTCTYVHMYYPYRLEHTASNVLYRLVLVFGNRDGPLCSEEGEVVG